MKINYRLFQWTDIDPLVSIINEVWQLDELCGSFDKGIIFSKLYLYEVLKDSTDIYVAVNEEDIIIGMIVLSLNVRDKLKIPIKYWEYLCIHPSLDLEEGDYYKNRILDYKNKCIALLKQHHLSFDAEIVLFATANKYQKMGIGNYLFNWAKEKIRQEKCLSYYLYTDTSCHYEYYDHQGMERIGSYQADDNEEFKIFLYGGK